MNVQNLMVACFSAAAVIAMFILLRPRFIFIPYERFMEVIDHEDWKSTDIIQEEMEKKHQGPLYICDVLDSLSKLKEEGLILHRTIILLTPEGKWDIHQFKRHISGDASDSGISIPPPTGHAMTLTQSRTLVARLFLIHAYSCCLFFAQFLNSDQKR
jgi:hypothetical protein